MNTIGEHEMYSRALTEHAWTLRLEGLTHKAIAARCGVCQSTAHQKVKLFSRRLNYALRQTRWRAAPVAVDE